MKKEKVECLTLRLKSAYQTIIEIQSDLDGVNVVVQDTEKDEGENTGSVYMVFQRKGLEDFIKGLITALDHSKAIGADLK